MKLVGSFCRVLASWLLSGLCSARNVVPSQDGYIKFGGLEDVFIETIST